LTEPQPAADPAQDPDADPEAAARAIVLRQLAMAARTRHQLRETLRKRETPPEVAEHVLDRMQAVGLINDEAFAVEYVAQRRASRGSGRRALAQELGRKGVPAKLIDQVLEDIDADDERVLASDLVRHKWRSVSGLEPTARRRRLASMLGRRGYPAGLVYEVIRTVEGEQGLEQIEVSDFSAVSD